MRTIGPAPSADEIEALARAALERLPAQFAEHLGDVPTTNCSPSWRSRILST
jgi:predicted Zn-dependent protease with MMP-like domain